MKFKYYSDTLKENLESFEEDYAEFINYGPNLFTLLCDILNDKRINKMFRLEIGAAISYFVIPNDVIPEEIYGPYGYIDDIFVATFVLKKVAKKYGFDFLQHYWFDDSDIKEIISECHDRSLEMLEDKVYPILSYCGLVD